MPIDFESVGIDDSNPEPRCPCILLLDTSGSMSGEPIRELNEGLRTFEQELKADELTQMRVEVAIVTFGPAMMSQDFVTANQFTSPTLGASGDTPMGEAIELALDKLEERKQVYKQSGLSHYRPWLFLITDGAPTDGERWRSAAQRVKDFESRKKISFFAVGVNNADMDCLRQIAVRAPLKLTGLSFKELFQWLSSSLTNVSKSKPGDEVPLAPPGWGTV